MGVSCHALLQGIFLTSGIEPVSLMSPALTGGFFSNSATWEALSGVCLCPCQLYADVLHVCSL